MLRNQSVMDIKMENNRVCEVEKIYNENLIPIHLKGNLSKTNLEKWLYSRMIPESRPLYNSINKYLKTNAKMTILSMVMFNHALSLSDQYWLCAEGIQAEWKDINFFENDFSYDMGNFLFTPERFECQLNWRSPDFTTNGICQKSWRSTNDKRYLIKAPIEKKGQEAINEAAISSYLSLVNFPYLQPAKNTLTKIKGRLCSVSENFLSEHTELVTAYAVYRYEPKPDGITPYSHLRMMCKKLNIPNACEFIDAMLLFDNVIANKDRHMGNFGFLRDTKTLEFLGPAPLYDNGSSLWFDEILLKPGAGVMDELAKPFGKLHKDNLKDIKNDALLRKLNIGEFRKILEETAKQGKFDRKQMEYVCENVESRYERVWKEREKIREREEERER